MKVLKRIGAIVLAIAMILAVCTTVFADTEIPSGESPEIVGVGDKPSIADKDSDGIKGRADDEFDAVENTVKIYKSIVFKNNEATYVYEPNIVYTYTITGVDVTDGQVSVTDEHVETPPHTVVVNDGSTQYVSGTTIKTVTFSDGNALVEATPAGTETKKPFTFSFDPDAFPHAGIYRFKITETVSDSPDARAFAGIDSSANYVTTRYLDVYVRNQSDALKEIYGFVLFEDENGNKNITSSTTKSNGWVNTATSGDPTDVDVYTTYNAYVQKHVEGSMGDLTHDFPFEITLTNTGTWQPHSTVINLDRNTKIRVKATDNKATIGDGTTTWTGTGSNQASNAYIALNGGNNVVLGRTTKKNTIRHNGRIELLGIPKDTTIMVEETNDSYDVYTASAKVDNSDVNIDYKATGTILDYTLNKASGSLSPTGLAKLNAVVVIDEKKEIDFKNTLTEISPTGIITRYAPYGLILVGGIVLLIISKKHKKHNEEED